MAWKKVLHELLVSIPLDGSFCWISVSHTHTHTRDCTQCGVPFGPKPEHGNRPSVSAVWAGTAGGGAGTPRFWRSQCKDCGGTGICQHHRRRSICKDCGGASIRCSEYVAKILLREGAGWTAGEDARASEGAEGRSGPMMRPRNWRILGKSSSWLKKNDDKWILLKYG